MKNSTKYGTIKNYEKPWKEDKKVTKKESVESVEYGFDEEAETVSVFKKVSIEYRISMWIYRKTIAKDKILYCS